MLLFIGEDKCESLGFRKFVAIHGYGTGIGRKVQYVVGEEFVIRLRVVYEDVPHSKVIKADNVTGELGVFFQTVTPQKLGRRQASDLGSGVQILRHAEALVLVHKVAADLAIDYVLNICRRAAKLHQFVKRSPQLALSFRNETTDELTKLVVLGVVLVDDGKPLPNGKLSQLEVF